MSSCWATLHCMWLPSSIGCPAAAERCVSAGSRHSAAGGRHMHMQLCRPAQPRYPASSRHPTASSRHPRAHADTKKALHLSTTPSSASGVPASRRLSADAFCRNAVRSLSTCRQKHDPCIRMVLRQLALAGQGPPWSVTIRCNKASSLEGGTTGRIAGRCMWWSPAPWRRQTSAAEGPAATTTALSAALAPAGRPEL